MKLEMSSENGWENLANTIVLQAAIDYRHSLRILAKHSPFRNYSGSTQYYLRSHVYKLNSLEHFFDSEYYSILTHVPPDLIVNHLRSEVDYEAVKLWRRKQDWEGISNAVRKRSRRY